MGRLKTARSFTSDTTDSEFDRVDTELIKLKREFRRLATGKKSLQLNVDTQLKSQNAQIKNLQEEQHQLELELSLADSDQNCSKDGLNLVRMQTNLERKASLFKQIEEFKTWQKQLDIELLNYQKKVHKQRIKMGGAEKTQNYHKVMNRKVDIAEGNLHRESSKFNNYLAN